MKIAVFTTHVPTWSHHYEIELEIMEKHRLSGDEVSHFVCNAQLVSCDKSLEFNFIKCIDCMGRRRFGRKLIHKKIETIPFLNLTKENKKEISLINEWEIKDINELKEIRIDNFDIGYAVVSTIISKLRDPNPKLTSYGKVINGLIKSALTVYRSFQNHLDRSRFDIVYVFNGRFAISRAVVRACESKKCDYYVLDRGHNNEYYAKYKNTLIHDFHNRAYRIKKMWNINKADPEREPIAEAYFINNSNGIESLWYSHTKTQIKNLLPDNWDKQKKNIAIFPNSEDEFAAISDEFKNTIYPSQAEGIKKIVTDLNQHYPNIHVYVRMHPHLKDIHNSSVTDLLYIKSPNLTVIPPDSLVNTYTLLKSADTVLTFGSTTGMEAVYWGVPSVLAGPYFYQDFGGTYNAKTHDEVIGLLSKKLKPKEKTAALMYGYYMSSFGKMFGEKYRYFHADDFKKGRFKGVYIKPKPKFIHLILRYILLGKNILLNFKESYQTNGLMYIIKLVLAIFIKNSGKIYLLQKSKSKKRWCPICQWRGRFFLPEISKSHISFNSICPACNSNQANRALKLCVKKIVHLNKKPTYIFYTAIKGPMITHLSSIQGVEIATPLYGKNDKNPNYVINLKKIPFLNETFDYVFYESSKNIKPLDEEILKEFNRILKSNGNLLVLHEKLTFNNLEDKTRGTIHNFDKSCNDNLHQQLSKYFVFNKNNCLDNFSKKKISESAIQSQIIFQCLKK